MGQIRADPDMLVFRDRYGSTLLHEAPCSCRCFAANTVLFGGLLLLVASVFVVIVCEMFLIIFLVYSFPLHVCSRSKSEL